MTVSGSIAATIAVMVNLGWTPAEALDRKQVECMARTVWGEARGDVANSTHVAHVVMNRTRSTGKTVCQVVRQKHQFAGYKKTVDPNHAEWRQSIEIAVFAMTGGLTDHTNGATHFYDRESGDPKWSKRMALVGHSRNHTYLKEAK